MATWTPDPSFCPSPRMAKRENRPSGALPSSPAFSETRFRFGFLEFKDDADAASR